MPPFDLDKADEAALQRIRDQRWQEGPSLDFKRELPKRDDKGRRELLKDVCAFANADGGLIVFGMEDKDGSAERITPIAQSTEGQDDAVLRLGQIIDAGVEPRIRGYRLHPVPVDGGFVLLLKVPASFDGPHRYHVNDTSQRFVVRSGRHTIDLTYQQLKSAFGNTDKLLERAREFRARRVLDLPGLQTPKQMPPGPLTFIHVIPIDAMSGRSSVDVMKLYYDHSPMTLRDWSGGVRQINLDGIVVSRVSASASTDAFTRLFRTGVVEMGRSSALWNSSDQDISGTVVSKYLREAIPKAIETLRKIEVTGPAIVGISMVRMQGYRFITSNHDISPSPDRPDFIFPEAWIDDLESPPPIDEIVRPVLDLLWQAYGDPRCSYYDDSGKWLLG